MLQPQSDAEIQPVVEQLQLLDPLLDVIWNPKARMVKAGSYSELGKRTDAEYDGRWQVVRFNTPGLHKNRDYVVIVTVCEWERVGRRGIIMMKENGGYAPIGEWLLEAMRQWDAAQRAFAAHMEELGRIHDEAEHGVLDAAINDRAAHQEGLERVYHQFAAEGGRSHLLGGAQGKAHPITVQTLFGKGKKGASSPTPAGV